MQTGAGWVHKQDICIAKATATGRQFSGILSDYLNVAFVEFTVLQASFNKTSVEFHSSYRTDQLRAG
jgi:hypothetical protein